MRFWRIALFVTFFEVAMVALGTPLGLTFDFTKLELVSSPITSVSPDAMVNPFGNPWYGVRLLADIGGGVVAGVYAILRMLGVPASIAGLAQMAASASQVAAVVQLVTGRRVE